MVFEQSEVVCLFLALAFAVPAVFLARVTTIPRSRWFFAGIFLAIGASVFTVVEGMALYDFMNLLEHICYAASATSFATGCWLLSGDLAHMDDQS